MMQRYLAFLVLFVAGVNAHFQLQFPPPRGAFDEDNEPKFCDGYNTPAATRTTFPLTGGFFSLNAEHPKWTAGVLVSSEANPTSFNDFSQAVPFFQVTGEGAFCIPLDFSANANTTSFKNGQNVTIQIVFDGGDATLYQCADLTLSNNSQISPDVKCSNATGSSAGTNSPSPTTGSSAPLSTQSSNAQKKTKLLSVVSLISATWAIAFTIV